MGIYYILTSKFKYTNIVGYISDHNTKVPRIHRSLSKILMVPFFQTVDRTFLNFQYENILRSRIEFKMEVHFMKLHTLSIRRYIQTPYFPIEV